MINLVKFSFHQKLESSQYSIRLAITRAITGASREKLYCELGFESPESRRWYYKLCYFSKVFKTQSPRYSFDIIPKAETAYIKKK